MTSNKESLETYVILSYPRYKALDQKAKKWEAQTASSQLPETPETMESHPPPQLSHLTMTQQEQRLLAKTLP